jgi:hypothetical protein
MFWELLTLKLKSKTLNRQRAKWVLAAIGFGIPILVVHSLESGEIQMDRAQYFVSLLAAIACCLAMILLGIAADRAPRMEVSLVDRLADKNQWRPIAIEALCSWGILAFFLGSIGLLVEMHPDRAQLLIGCLSICASGCLLTAVWLFLSTKAAPLNPAVPTGHSALSN